ncbi:MAG: cytochrome c3 family protein [Duodenibacillus sp.]|nr:cytochrome c3 family protein [Duodenibacillus sp.]
MFAKAAALAAALVILASPSLASAQAAGGSHKSFGCQQCHQAMPPKAPSAGPCIGCHGGYDKLKRRTAHRAPNPHAFHGGRLACAACHAMHKPGPARTCAACHDAKGAK